VVLLPPSTYSLYQRSLSERHGLRYLGALLAVVLLALVPTVSADTITLDGAVFTVTYTHLTGNTYVFDYSINTSGYTGPGHYLDSVALNPNGSSILGGSFSGPSGWVGAHGNQQGPGGCGGGAGNFWCAQAGSLASLLLVPGGTYDFDFTLTLASPMTADSTPHIQASFGDIACRGRHCTPSYQNQFGVSTGLLTETPPLTHVSDVPEPGTITLFGSGLIGALGLLRRRFNA
jgi:hypothetical protein